MKMTIESGTRKIDPLELIVVTKLSKYEWDMRKTALDHEVLMGKYRKDGEDAESIYQSHLRQHEALSTLKKYLREEQFIAAEKFSREIAAKANAVVAFGGDDHFKYISHFIDDTLIIGVNSDPATSEGALTYFTPSKFVDALKNLKNGYFPVEKWARLEAIGNGNAMPLALSEYFLGEKERLKMSGYIITHNGETERQKSSGLLVVTPAGTTGWYDSACRYVHPNGNKVSKSKMSARYLATEMYRGQLTGYTMVEGSLEPGQELVVKSLNKHNGLISPDSIEEIPFPRGAAAVIKISDKPLKVVARME